MAKPLPITNFLCIVCGDKTVVIDSRQTRTYRRRRRQCVTYESHRFTTQEYAIDDIKRSREALAKLKEVQRTLSEY